MVLSQQGKTINRMISTLTSQERYTSSAKNRSTPGSSPSTW